MLAEFLKDLSRSIYGDQNITIVACGREYSFRARGIGDISVTNPGEPTQITLVLKEPY